MKIHQILILIALIFIVSGVDLRAQAPDAVPNRARDISTTQPRTPKNTSSFLGTDLPLFDPASEMISWDGKAWDINNNRILKARFEKYLNTPPENSNSDRAYHELIETILQKLSPENYNTKSIESARALLSSASQYPSDAGLCGTIAQAIFTVSLSKKEQRNLIEANEELERERKAHEWNLKIEESRTTINPHGAKKTSGKSSTLTEQEVEPQNKAPESSSIAKRLAEVELLMAANKSKKAVSEVQSKVEFQELIVQLFLQRRFQHVIIASRFYRHIFGDGDTTIKASEFQTQSLRSAGIPEINPPSTLGTFESLAHEAIRDVHEGVCACQYLLDSNQLESASKRLAEAYLVGEFMPEIQTLPIELKQRCLEFTKKANQLISALQVKDFSLAEELVNDLKNTAKDFDSSKQVAIIETAKTVSKMHLQAAKNAAVSGNKDVLEKELHAATEIWPQNPDLKQVSNVIFSQADVQESALVDLDQLISQHNYRQIFNDKLRFIAATVLDPKRQEKLVAVLEKMEKVETAILKSNERVKQGDFSGAWETLERVYEEIPDDSKLNELRGNMSSEAAEFVKALRMGQQLEEKNQVGSSLAWFLKAQELYPPSDFAKEGISRIVKKVLPDA